MTDMKYDMLILMEIFSMLINWKSIMNKLVIEVRSLLISSDTNITSPSFYPIAIVRMVFDGRIIEAMKSAYLNYDII